MKYLWRLCLLVLCQSMVYANNYQIGHRQITFIDSSRANRQIQCEIYYPSMNAGDNVPMAEGKFPVLVFGHGFVMPVSAYDVYWNALVPKGYIMVLPTTESSFSPSHTNFGKDIAHAVKSMRLQGILASSPFYNSVDSTSAVMGHSMGGGCAFLAMQYDQQITAIVSFAGAVTNPSSVTAASSITKPSLVIAGANDCVAPPKNHQIPMYDSLASQCKSYVSIIGGDHCQFASYNFNCSFGQSTCTPKATINANTQQSILFQHMIPWLNYYLKRDCIAGDQFQGMLSSPNGIMSNTNCTLESPRPNILGQKLPCMSENAELYIAGNASGFIPQWTVPKKGTVIGSLNQDSIKVLWNISGIDTVKLRLTHPETGCFKDTILIVTIQPAPNTFITGLKEVCANSKGQLYSVAQSPNIVQLWRKPLNGLTDSDLTKSTISIEWTKNGVDTIFVRQTNTITNCIKDTFMIVTINELPEGTIIGEQIVCESNKNVNYLIQSSPGTTIEWHVPNNGLIIGSKTSNTVAIRWNMRGIDTVKATITDPSTGCMRDTFMIVTIQEKPNADIYGKKNICEDTPMSTYKVEAIPGLSYFWTVSTTSTIIGPRNLDSVLVRWTKVGKDIISLRATNPLTGCTNDTSLTITVNPKPRPYITGKSLVKEGDTNIVYAVPFNQGSMYSWNILSGDARIRNQDQYQVNIDIGKPGIIMIEVTESNKYDCASSDTFNISVQSASGIDDEHFMLIYPNPIEHSSILTIKGNELLSAELWTIMGENIGKYLPQNDNSISISTESCTSGMYMIRIRTNKGCINSSVMIH
jgi:dienelactone hydrolase